MIWSFKNKLRSLNEDEFIEYLQNKDEYPKKHRPYIAQEARNRYFSNKHFNGDDDQYINPKSQFLRRIRRKKRIKNTSAVLSLLIVATALFFIIQTNPRIGDQFVTIFQSQNKTKENTPLKNNAPIVIAKNDEALKPQGDKQKKTPIKTEETAADKTAIKPKSKQLEISKTKEQLPSESETDIKKETQKNNSTVPSPPPPIKEQDQKKPTATPVKSEPTAQANEGNTSMANKNEIEKNPEIKPKKEPINNLHDASELSTTRLREFIPFLNDWAYQQTNLPGIADYYVENNSIVNFKLTAEYADSIGPFQQHKSKQFIEKYRKDLSTKLGNSFPKIDIKIRFVDSETDL